jgi:hypothetical protein
MSARQFIQKENIEMVWDVICDEELFRFLPRDSQMNVHQLFVNNLQGFYDAERKKTNSLVEINKKYIMLILGYIKKNFPVKPSKITIHNEQPANGKELITFEEIQNERKSKFEQELNRKQEEFEDLITLKTPPAPDFSEKEADKPIKEMDKILKEMQIQRNYEIEQINRTYNTNKSSVDNWLKPQETSLKPRISNNSNNTGSDKKNVSFSNVEEVATFSMDEDNDINDEDSNDLLFSKLKKMPKKDNEERISNLENELKLLNLKIDRLVEVLNEIRIDKG